MIQQIFFGRMNPTYEHCWDGWKLYQQDFPNKALDGWILERYLEHELLWVHLVNIRFELCFDAREVAG